MAALIAAFLVGAWLGHRAGQVHAWRIMMNYER